MSTNSNSYVIYHIFTEKYYCWNKSLRNLYIPLTLEEVEKIYFSDTSYTKLLEFGTELFATEWLRNNIKNLYSPYEHSVGSRGVRMMASRPTYKQCFEFLIVRKPCLEF